MNAFKNITKLTLAVYAAIALSACGKTSNNGTAASTPPTTSTCTLQTDGSYRNGSGALCSSGSFTCPASGQYTDSTGNHTCTPGQTVNVNNNYPYPNNPSTGCDYWTQYYGQLYIPMLLNGSYVCANYLWLNSYSYGTPYYDNPNYWYQYPPYSQQGSSSCNTAVALSYGNFSGAVCF